jgi:hypothetical protein
MARGKKKDVPGEIPVKWKKFQRISPGNEENHITYLKDSLILFGS